MISVHAPVEKLQAGQIAVIDVSFDLNSSFLKGAALAPPKIREALFCESANMWTEAGVDLNAATGWKLVESLGLENDATTPEKTEATYRDLLARDIRIISLGGDHSITYPIIQAYGKAYDQLNVVQLDAHPDLYDELDGNRYSHACPFARIMEEGLVRRLVQVGVRTMTGHQQRQADRFGVEVIDMHNLSKANAIEFNGPVYLSIDLDCLDPAFAPGVSHHEPGGMSTRDVIQLIQGLHGSLVGADIVELNPVRDPQGITAMVAAKLLKEVLSSML
jgi:agmatinase